MFVYLFIACFCFHIIITQHKIINGPVTLVIGAITITSCKFVLKCLFNHNKRINDDPIRSPQFLGYRLFCAKSQLLGAEQSGLTDQVILICLESCYRRISVLTAQDVTLTARDFKIR